MVMVLRVYFRGCAVTKWFVDRVGEKREELG